MNCGPCVHKSAVAKYHNVSGFSVLPSMDPCHKALYHYIADGRTEENVWYRPLNQPDARPNIAEYIEECRAPPQNQSVTLAEETPTDDSEERRGSLDEEDDDHEEDDGHKEDDVHDEDLVESGAEGSSGTDTSDDDTEELIEKLTNVLEQVKIKVIDNLDKDEVKKSAKSMIKNFDRGVKGNMQTFSKTLFSVGKEVTAPAKSGAKRKNRGLIPVQQTAKSRRVWKHRGSQPATGGRKVKDLELRTEMLLDFGGEDNAVYHSLPKQKKQKPKQVHSLNSSVQANRAGTKKH